MEMNFCRFTLLTSYQQREKNKLFQLRFWGYEKCPFKSLILILEAIPRNWYKEKSLQLKFSYKISSLQKLLLL